jgi:alpha-D-ribose 1-methylphosphonate 5-triphosphate diphosphatase PhnM
MGIKPSGEFRGDIDAFLVVPGIVDMHHDVLDGHD